MDIYVANCSQQASEFWYRVPEYPAPLHAAIPIGGQAKLPAPAGGFNKVQADRVIEQLARRASPHVNEARNSSNQVWLAWDNKPISPTTMLQIIERNQGFLKADGEKRRKQAAVAIDTQVEALGNAHHFQAPDAIEVSMVEQETPSNPSPQFSEGLRVSRTEQPGEPPKPGRRRRTN